ncbi:centrosomal protein of 68 kDa [Salmo trutta]|uniref:Centrosomal protein 68 n=1 Tax=Salmo trutta TaxID=8032 RepID=A0A673WYW4_SALTR|nr:centrosomal protein of 68 kDa-like [Salmo trutta]XP_029608825.1 centrosomal protein of 68 kDa-like [Salmo trutta]XP_029608827.1 centrosomal protein of 68 kDa-like [Salmo trutta]
MALGVDRAFPASISPMESKGCSGRWKTRIPEFIRTGTTTTQHDKDGERGTGGRDRGGPRKSVTMAPTSRYMSDRRQYSMRKPLVTTTEQQTSILKKSYLQEHPEKERQWEGSSNEAHHHSEFDFQTRLAEQKFPDNFDPSQANISTCSASREDLGTSLGVSDLRTCLSHEEPTFSSSYLGSRPGQRSLSSPPLEVHTFSTPLNSKWTSTLLSPLSPSYTPPSRPSRQRWTELRLDAGEVSQSRGGGREMYLNVGPSVGYSKGHSNPVLHTMSPHQANYWACAIPSSLPPSPDRRSSSWDPDKEYQALLDYTYPLRPGRVVGGWDTSDAGGGPLIQTDPGLQDSGIDLDRLCSSTSLSALDFSLTGTAGVGTDGKRRMPGIGQRSSELRGLSHPKSSDGRLSSSPLSSADPIGLSVESLDCSGGGGLDHLHRIGEGRYRHHGISSTTFIRTTSILPQPGCIRGGSWDEEFWSLPEQLEELRGLSQQVREVTAQLSQPVTASWESLERGTTSVQSSVTLAEKQEAEEEGKEWEQNEKEEREGEKQVSISEALQYFSKVSKVVHSGESSQAARNSGSRMEAGVAGRGVSRASLREVEAMVNQLSGLTLPEFQRGSQGEQGHRESLMQHIQTFCSNLEELIQWLYTVVERMEVLAPPSVDIESVKSSLADYKRFQREVTAHQPLTTSVLQTGELLLGCMTATSPVLKETLGLIERQSRALETHSEHLFSSILSAMDSLTQPGEPCGAEETGAGDTDSVEVQGTAQ